MKNDTGQDDEVASLNELITACENSRKVLGEAFGRTEDAKLKSVLSELEGRLNAASDALRERVREIGADAAHAGSLVGDVRKLYLDVKTAFVPDERRAIVEEIERSRARTLDAFHAMLRGGLSPDNAALVREQYERLRAPAPHGALMDDHAA